MLKVDSWRILLLITAGFCVSCCQSHAVPPPAEPLVWGESRGSQPSSSTEKSADRPPPADAGVLLDAANGTDSQTSSTPANDACSQSWGQQLALIACDWAQIRLRHDATFEPMRRLPKEPARGVLRAVGQIMREHPEIQLIRIEVAEAGDSDRPELQRQSLGSTQRRADAIFRQLWRGEGVSAERMEALGIGYRADAARDRRFTTRIRIVQRR